MLMYAFAFHPQEYLLGLTESSHLYAGDSEVCIFLSCFIGSEEAAELIRNMCICLCLLSARL